MFFFGRAFVFAFSLICVVPLQADEDKVPVRARGIDVPAEETASVKTQPATAAEAPFFSFLDSPQHAVSSGLKSFAASIDEFFADEKVFYQATGSYIRLTYDSIWDEGGQVGFVEDVKLKIKLPKTEEKLKLTLETNPEEQRDDIDRAVEDAPVTAAEEKDYYAGIQAEAGKKEQWKFSTSFSGKIGKTPDYFARFRVDKSTTLGNWLHSFNQTFFWFNSSGYGSSTSYDIDHKLAEDILFRSATHARWTEENEYFDLSQVFSLSQVISDRRSISYQAGVYGISEPTVFATTYLLTANYRQNIHADYLFVNLIPQIRYRKENEFHAEHSLLFRIEMVFKG